MNCKVYLASAISVIGMLVMADFSDDFQEALKLYNNGKSNESIERFAGLAKTAPTPGSKADSLQYAVMSAIKLKQYDKAKEMISQISRESTRKLCQMNLMTAQDQAQELVNAFKDEDFSKWPDFHVYDAFSIRGQAYERLKCYPEALRDYKKALEIPSAPGRKAMALLRLGMLLQISGDDEQALSVFRQMGDISSLKGHGIINDGIIRAARILAKQSKYDEAQKELAKIKPESSGYWYSSTLMVQAEICLAQDKKGEAQAKYNEALKGAPEDLRKSIQTAIEKIK